MEEIPEPIKSAPEPTTDDKIRLDEIVKTHLGEQAAGDFLGAKARGVKGDAAFYGHAVVIIDPNITKYRDNMATYYEKLEKVASAIGNTISNAANVTINVTYLTEE